MPDEEKALQQAAVVTAEETEETPAVGGPADGAEAAGPETAGPVTGSSSGSGTAKEQEQERTSFPAYEYTTKRGTIQESGYVSAAAASGKVSFWTRLAAGAIDGILSFAAASALTGLLPSGASAQTVFFDASLGRCLTVAGMLVYAVLMTYFCGGGLGKKALKIRVVDRETGGSPSLWQVIFRESVGKYLSCMSLGIGFFLIASAKGSLHDRLSDTDVRSTRQSLQA